MDWKTEPFLRVLGEALLKDKTASEIAVFINKKLSPETPVEASKIRSIMQHRLLRENLQKIFAEADVNKMFLLYKSHIGHPKKFRKPQVLQALRFVGTHDPTEPIRPRRDRGQ